MKNRDRYCFACGAQGVHGQGLCPRCYFRKRQRECMADPRWRQLKRARARAFYHAHKAEIEEKRRAYMKTERAKALHAARERRYRFRKAIHKLAEQIRRTKGEAPCSSE